MQPSALKVSNPKIAEIKEGIVGQVLFVFTLSLFQLPVTIRSSGCELGGPLPSPSLAGLMSWQWKLGILTENFSGTGV